MIFVESEIVTLEKKLAETLLADVGMDDPDFSHLHALNELTLTGQHTLKLLDAALADAKTCGRHDASKSVATLLRIRSRYLNVVGRLTKAIGQATRTRSRAADQTRLREQAFAYAARPTYS